MNLEFNREYSDFKNTPARNILIGAVLLAISLIAIIIGLINN